MLGLIDFDPQSPNMLVKMAKKWYRLFKTQLFKQIAGIHSFVPEQCLSNKLAYFKKKTSLGIFSKIS